MNFSVYVFISGKEVVALFLNQKCNREGLWILSFKTWKHSFNAFSEKNLRFQIPPALWERN